MENQYQSGPASLFSSAARRGHWVGEAGVDEQQFQCAKDFLKGKKVVTTQALREALELTELSAYRVMRRLEEEELIAAEWDIYKGGFPVLRSM